MTRLLSLFAIPLLAIGVCQAAAPPPATEVLPATIPLLHIHEIDHPCDSETILAPSTTPEKRPALFIHRTTVPCMETVFVRRTHQEKQLRLVYRPVERQETLEVLVPVVTRCKKVRMVYRRHTREELRPRLVYVKTTRPEKRLRMVYRPIERREPWTHDVYVPIVTREKRMRLVYLSEPVRITRTVPRVRMQDVPVHDPLTGKSHTTQKPICEQEQITETARRITPCMRPIEETVTSYRLERRTDMRTHTEYVLQCQLLTENVTRYHLETRLIRERAVCYLAQPEVVEETVKNYRRECRTVTRRDYVPEWREVEETVHTYHLETRRVMRRVDQVITCPGEIIVPVTRMQPIPFTSLRRITVVEPLVAPGCGSGISGGFVSSGASADSPVADQ